MKKKETLPFATTSMDLESIMLGNMNQTEKDKYTVISLICRIQKQQQPPSSQYREQIGGCQRWGQVGAWQLGKMGEGVKRYKLPVIK